MNILIIGGNGQLGRCLQDRLSYLDYKWLAVDKDILDITNEDDVSSYFNLFKPQLVINAAAYTAVDKAETEIEEATAVNSLAPEFLAKYCNRLDIPLIHISTDYVFDGHATIPYKPSDIPNPQNVYGKTKLKGEQAVCNILDKHLVIRTSWVFSEYGNNFLKTMLRLSQTNSVLKIVGDQYGCPTYAGHLADAIVHIIYEIQSGNQNWGIFHYCGDQITSWHGFARAIFDEAENQGIIKSLPELRVINTDEYSLPASRPNYSVLNIQTINELWRVQKGCWREVLARVISLI